MPQLGLSPYDTDSILWLLRLLVVLHFRIFRSRRDLLLENLALQTPEEATEQQVGIYVFQRRPGFNTSEDSIVRSQARLLRMKLSDYFAAEGASEGIRIEIPKGCYLPEFSGTSVGRFSSMVNGDETAGARAWERNSGRMHGPRLVTRRKSVNGSIVLCSGVRRADDARHTSCCRICLQPGDRLRSVTASSEQRRRPTL